MIPGGRKICSGALASAESPDFTSVHCIDYQSDVYNERIQRLWFTIASLTFFLSLDTM